MRKTGTKNECRAWLSARDTEDWANRPGSSWPCSTLAGKKVFVEVSRGDLVDIRVNGSINAADNVDGHELDAILQDFDIRD